MVRASGEVGAGTQRRVARVLLLRRCVLRAPLPIDHSSRGEWLAQLESRFCSLRRSVAPNHSLSFAAASLLRSLSRTR